MANYRTPKGDRDLIPWSEIITDVKPDPADEAFELVTTREATIQDLKDAILLKRALDARRDTTAVVVEPPPERPTTTSVCDKCGAEYPSAPAGVIHKCGRCSGGMMKVKVEE